MFGVKASVLYVWKSIKKKVSNCEQNMAGRKKYSLKEAVDLVLQATTNIGVESLHRSLKHCYLRLSGAGSLANLASNLIDEFVPDQMMAYGQKNFRCSDMYKVFHGEVPYYLHNRPRSIVQHCLSSTVHIKQPQLNMQIEYADWKAHSMHA